MSTTQLVLASGITLMAPVLWASLGELVSEQAGVMNIGIEGVMILAAFVAALVYQRTGSAVEAVVLSLLAGLGCGVILAVLFVWLRTDQIVTGIVFVGLATGLAAVLSEQYLDNARVASIGAWSVPLLSDLPWIGTVLFDHNILVFAAIVAIPVIAYLLHGTWFGLHARAAGERPLVDETAGLSVRGIRTVAVLIGCVMAAMGGVTLVLSTAGTFTPGITAGRGYLALAVVVLARWNPVGAGLAAFLFGVAQALQFQVAGIPLLSGLPQDIVLMIPYVVAATVVLVTSGSRYPEAVGVPYRPQASSS